MRAKINLKQEINRKKKSTNPKAGYLKSVSLQGGKARKREQKLLISEMTAGTSLESPCKLKG